MRDPSVHILPLTGGVLTWVVFLWGDPDLLDALIHFFMSF